MRASYLLALLLVIACLVFALLAWRAEDVFYLRLATEALIFAGLALSVDILLGYTGLLSLGQALYFGLGAYTSAVALRAGTSFAATMAIVLALSIAVSLAGGVIVNRVRGVYFALITFGMAQVAAKVVYNTRELGASDGLIGVPIVPIDLGFVSTSSASPVGFFLFTLAFIVLIYLVVAYFLDTPFGRVLIALKANERRVPFLGYRPFTARLVAYVMAGVTAALAGALYPMLRGFVSPELLSFTTSGNAVITIVTGGAGTLIGAVYGSLLLTALRSFVGSWTTHHLMVIGILFMAVVVLFPKGLIGFARIRLERLLERRQ
ncbi:MAG: branched-chain amino acid ABC transporter permease [Methylobacteriaceae bacterium]|nr:branched-chain amino acid ABC transporter permease [Methylobacteriaceae bacterium]